MAASTIRENLLIGEVVHRARVARGMSLSELAACAGVAKSTISVVERGRTNPSVALLARIGRALGD